MYLTFDEYQDLGGTLEEAVFEEYEFGAEVLIDYATFNRLKNDTDVCDEVKRLIYYLIGIAINKENTMSLGKSSTDSSTGQYITNQSNDGVSVSYSGMNATELYSVCNKEANRAILRYLQNVENEAGRKVLYRGLYPGE